MPPTRETATAADPATVYSLELMTEYSHTLDALPIELSRNFADLRELDAVLSSSMAAVTAKILQLTDMIESGTGVNEERLWLLTEITDEAARLRPGGEDKIRVACQAADNLRNHLNHMRSLAEHIPGFDASKLDRKTTYPHVAAKSFMPTSILEGGRRRRGNRGSLLAAAAATVAEPSPMKRKRGVKEDDGDVRSPRKEKVVDPTSRPRPNGRTTSNRRAASPAESILSVTSHARDTMPVRGIPTHSSSSRTANGHSTTNKRARTNNSRTAVSPGPNGDQYTAPYEQPSTSFRGRESSSHRQYNGPPASTHPSLPMNYNNGDVYKLEMPPPITNGKEWNVPRQLEGPGVPVKRNTPTYSVSESYAVNSSALTDNGTDDGEDNRTYCYCQRVSFGDMIACDQSNCEIEWFHLACVGLDGIPEGKWYCENCSNKRNTSKRSNRGGKRRAGGGRAGGRGA